MGNTIRDNEKLPNIYRDAYYESFQGYYGQEPKDRVGCGNPTYERQKPNHWGEMPSGRDGYGNPIYGDSNDNSMYGGGYSIGGGQSNSGALPHISSRDIERTQQRMQEESNVPKETNSNKKETKIKTSKEQEQPKKEDDKDRDRYKNSVLQNLKKTKMLELK